MAQHCVPSAPIRRLFIRLAALVRLEVCDSLSFRCILVDTHFNSCFSRSVQPIARTLVSVRTRWCLIPQARP
jgi:hypothetical protein